MQTDCNLLSLHAQKYLYFGVPSNLNRCYKTSCRRSILYTANYHNSNSVESLRDTNEQESWTYTQIEGSLPRSKRVEKMAWDI